MEFCLDWCSGSWACSFSNCSIFCLCSDETFSLNLAVVYSTYCVLFLGGAAFGLRIWGAASARLKGLLLLLNLFVRDLLRPLPFLPGEEEDGLWLELKLDELALALGNDEEEKSEEEDDDKFSGNDRSEKSMLSKRLARSNESSPLCVKIASSNFCIARLHSS